MNRRLLLAFALCLAACGDDSSGPDAGSNQLVVGALLSLTGGGATLGRTSEAALHLAADDVNARLSADGSPTRVSLRVTDTGLDPATALDRLRTLAGEGVRIFVGPQSSSEVAAIKPFADSAGVIILSQGSTASSLSLPDDNVFRLVPDDSHEGQALVALAASEGIQTIVPLWRDDAGNRGLHDAVARLFQEQGGTVTTGASYPPGTTNFSLQLVAVRSQVADAIAQHGAGTVAVYLAGFEESALIFAQATDDPLLAEALWYGGDGTVQSAAVLADPTAAEFAAATLFRAPTYGLDDELLAQDAALLGTIEARSGLRPDAFTLAGYDALHLASLTYAQVGLGDIELYRAQLLRRAGEYTGATGLTELNANGDRAVGDYDFYQVCGGPTPSWQRAAAYRAAGGTIVFEGSC